ncbi:hypothetical protein NHF45_12480 [Maricaulaceae bacterium NA33B04]|nr:hypothetical protein [Maricaulaceae bacterium NA33B04]
MAFMDDPGRLLLALLCKRTIRNILFPLYHRRAIGRVGQVVFLVNKILQAFSGVGFSLLIIADEQLLNREAN